MKRTMLLTALIFTLGVIPSCGGGGGGGGTSGDNNNTNTAPTLAIIKLSVTGTTAQIGGVDATITLPSGVTVKSTTNPPETDSGVVVASGQAVANSMLVGTYTAASGSSAASVRVALVNAAGFSPGEFATVTCDVAAGASPAATDFTVQTTKVSDTTGSSLSGATVTAAVTVQ